MRYRVIRTELLSKFFGGTRGIEDVTLEVEPGEVFGLLGPRGAGKTTFIRLLLDFIRPTSGRAVVLFLDSHRSSLEIRKQVGYIPSDLYLDGRLTAAEMLSYLARLRGGVDWQRVVDLAGRFKLDLTRKISLLPTCDRQKIGLVQAFMHDPELFLLDEPTAGLDTAAQSAFFRLVSETRAAGKSVFITTSQLSDAERVCDRVGIINAGRLVAVERAVQLRSRSLRKIEMRFSGPVTVDSFMRLPNVHDLSVEENLLRCTVQGDTDALIKAASQYRVTDFISLQPSLEEAFRVYYGVNGYAAA